MKLHLSALCLLLLLSVPGCSKKQGGGDTPDAKGSSKQGSSGSSASSSNGSSGAGEGKQGQAEPGAVRIKREDQPKAGIVIAEVEARAMPQLLTVPAQVAMDDTHTSQVGAIAAGRVTAVYVLPGQSVRRGTVLAQFHSDSVHETVGALAKAFADADRQRSAVAFAQQAQERYAKLYDRELIPIRSPMDGVVVARNVTVGQVLDAGFDAFDVSNLSTVWVMAAVNEKDIGLVRNGAEADVVTQAYPDTAFPARVERVGDLLDPTTRTIPVRIAVRNPDTALRPGMFASAHIEGPGTRTALFVPEDALQDVNGNQVVFTTRDGETFKAQIVTLGTRTKGKAEVVEGLKPGDHVVVNGAFMVKGELLKGTVGDG